MATRPQFEINGVIDTSASVLENINTLATASGCFVTWDEQEGQWSVIINTAGTSKFSFDDSNIVSSININGTGVTELYNSATVSFPNADARDTVDFVDVAIPANERFSNELDNTLEIKLDCINNPVQAEYIAARELKQSRVDKVVSFTTNFLGNGVKAGDIIDVTATSYGYSEKLFRVISVEEEDDDEGNILFGITALEYDANVYATSGLERNARSKSTGVVQKINNEEVQTSEDVNFGKQIAGLLVGNAAASLLRNILTVDEETGVLTNDISFQDENLQEFMQSFEAPPVEIQSSAVTLCEGETATLNATSDCNSCFFNSPQFTYDYSIVGADVSDGGELGAQIDGETVEPEGKIALGQSLTVTHVPGKVTEQKTVTVTIGNDSTDIELYPTPDASYEVSAAAASITEGDSVDITVTTTGVEDGTTIPYTITGSATSKITSPSLTGNITINSNTASVTVETEDDSEFNPAESFVFSIDPGVTPNPCALYDFDAAVSVENDDATGPEPPQPPDDKTCEYVQVPLVWCAIYDGEDDELKGVSVRKSVYLPVAQAGEATVSVPSSLSITKGNPSTITVASTVDVASSSSLGGVPFQVITAFNTVAPLGLITGSSTATVYGYDV